uniref:Uncharacterized protein n=1 Tax=Acrobeloides nanus TaxID=290746 RepID=A0A914DIS0_9BILA
MKLIGIISFFLFAFLNKILAESSGAQIRITQDGIDKAVYSLVEALNKHFEAITLDEQSFQASDVKGSIFDGKLSTFRLDPRNSKIYLQDNGTIKVDISNIVLNGDSQYKVRWHFLKKSGSIALSTNDAYIQLIFRIFNENSRARLRLIRSSASVGNMDFKLHGNIVDKLINRLKKVWKPKVRNAIDSKIPSLIEKKVNELSEKIVQIEVEKDLAGKMNGIYVNYGLTGHPKNFQNALFVSISSKFWYGSNKIDYHSSGNFPNFPREQDVCVEIDSKVVFNSLTDAFTASRKGHKKVETNRFQPLKHFLSCECQGKFCAKEMPDGRCGEDYIIDLNFAPSFHFNDSGVYTVLNVNASFEYNGFDVLDVQMIAGIHLKNTISFANWVLRGQLEIFLEKISADSWLVATDEENLHMMWNMFKDVIETELNEMLKDGIPLPSVRFVQISNPQVYFNGPFVQVCANTDINFAQILK